MSDNNPTLRSTLARLLGGVFGYQFTTTIEIGGKRCDGIENELSQEDKLLLAGTENLRCKSVGVQQSQLGPAVYDEGDQVTVGGDPDWQIKNWRQSPDGALIIFLLINGS